MAFEKERKRFSEYVSSCSFRIDLSKNMIFVLMALYTQDKQAAISNSVAGGLNVGPYKALKRRGLITYKDEHGNHVGPELTAAGELVCELIKLAEEGK